MKVTSVKLHLTRSFGALGFCLVASLFALGASHSRAASQNGANESWKGTYVQMLERGEIRMGVPYCY